MKFNVRITRPSGDAVIRTLEAESAEAATALAKAMGAVEVEILNEKLDAPVMSDLRDWRPNMTVAQLRDVLLARKLTVPEGAKKADIIAALTADDGEAAPDTTDEDGDADETDDADADDTAGSGSPPGDAA